MNPHLDMLADVIVELAAREIETPSFETRRDDGVKVKHEHLTRENLRRMPGDFSAG
jgi:hypothetical protein